MAQYARTRRFRIYEHSVLPGIFQTESYARGVLSFWREFHQVPDDVDQAVRFRLARAERAMNPAKRIAVVLTEAAIRNRYCNDHDDQLIKLLSVMSRPYVSLGIIPLDAIVRCSVSVGFWIYDDSAVYFESPSAEIKVSRPSEIEIFSRVFLHLQSLARYGPDARRLITKALDQVA
jgi:hypothetical protein